MQKLTFSALFFFITDEDDEGADKNSLSALFTMTTIRAQIKIYFFCTL